jgi:hypothetical protein
MLSFPFFSLFSSVFFLFHLLAFCVIESLLNSDQKEKKEEKNTIVLNV